MLLHDPQTAGMAGRLAAAGAHVVWRCHVGRESTNDWTDVAWSFLRRHLAACSAYVFSSVPDRVDAHLGLVGPATAEVTDDPEGAEVLGECVAAWEELPMAARRRVSLVTLPMEDIDENAAMVNAVQRHAAVIVQKSLAEGFGLTVAEGMWKAKAVLASNVGGIAAQIAPGTGLLLRDPTDLFAFGETLATLLSRPDEVADMGKRARQHVLDGFIGDKHLIRYAHLIGWLVAQ